MDVFSKGTYGTIEDFVEYTIHSRTIPVGKDGQDYLLTLRDECLTILSPYTIEYMWHQDPFTLKVKDNHLHGLVKIGDNIEDEWFIISLLFKLTEIKLDLVIRVVDQDGEVLLIETADLLPMWAQDPEATDCRVYIYRNQMHLIPVAQNPAQLTPLPAGTPRWEDAVETVRNYSHVTRMPPKIQSAIRRRMKSYPDDWSDQKQFCHVTIPLKVKRLLPMLPKYIVSAAIRSFYIRDMVDVRNCRTMKNFSPREGGPHVKVGLTLSKCLYAMLVKQQFKPDKKAGWTMPSCPPQGSADYKASDLGMKLTCGLEILASQSKISTASVSHGHFAHANFDESSYKKFESALCSSGYFKGEMEGSKTWRMLSNQAREYFATTFSLPETNSTKTNSEIPSSDQLQRVINRLGNEFFCDYPEQNSVHLNDEKYLRQPDDDSWLDLAPGSFDEMLRNHFKVDGGAENCTTRKSDDAIPSELKTFLQSMSEYDGVEIPTKHGEEHKRETREHGDGDMNFNCDDFQKAVAKILGMNKGEAGYGKSLYRDISADDNDDVKDIEDYEIKDEFENTLMPEVKSYYDQMKAELLETKVMSNEDDNVESLEDIDKPINLDAKVLKNILESYNSQNGSTGPVTTLLNPLGIDFNKSGQF